MCTCTMRSEMDPLKFYPGLINALMVPWRTISKENINGR